MIHDPTTLNRRRSAIFYPSQQQKADVEPVIGEITQNKLYRDPIVTEVKPVSTFYIAEDYHQGYFARNPGQGYCQFVVAPKVAKFRKHFMDRLKKPA